VRPFARGWTGCWRLAGGGLEDAADVIGLRLRTPRRPCARRWGIFSQHEVRKPGIVLVTSDRGLCGAFNTSLIRAAQAIRRIRQECKLIVIGRRVRILPPPVDPILYHRVGISDKLELSRSRT
jgi:hypothetical protein